MPSRNGLRHSLVSILLGGMLIGCAPTAPTITITWSTASEMNTAGWLIERSAADEGPFERISNLIPSSDDPFIGHAYEFIDRDVEAGRTYYYQLLTVTNSNDLINAGELSAVAR